MSEGATVRLTEGVAGIAGLCSCGSVWSCPVCAARIAQRRALEIAAAVGAARAQGHEVALLTFTMRHDRGQALELLWAGLSDAWKRVTTGRVWIRSKTALGVLGWLRVAEVTWGLNGWHVHLHVLVVLAGGTDRQAMKELGEQMSARWFAGLAKAGLSALPVGQEAHLLEGDGGDSAVATYLAKAAGFEMAYSQGKVARGPHSTDSVWKLLDDFVATGERTILELWREYEFASSGKRQLTWSQSLRADLGLVEVEKTDEQIAAEELGTADDGLVLIKPAGWTVLVRNPTLIPLVYEAAEHGGQGALARLLSAHDVAHVLI